MTIERDEAVRRLVVSLQRAPKELIDRVLARIDAEAAKRSPEETARLERLLGERDGPYEPAS